MLTWELVFGWGLSGAISLACMRLFKANTDVIKAVENMFIVLFMVVALTALLRLIPGSVGQGLNIR